MSSLGPMSARWSIVAVPFILFSCFSVDDGGGGDDDGSNGCRRDRDCPSGRLCIDVDGNRDDTCEAGESCACGLLGAAGEGNGGSSPGGANGDDDGSTVGGSAGNATGGSSQGGSTQGGSTNGGAGGSGATTGGSSNAGRGGSTGGSSTGGQGGSAGVGGGPSCADYCARVLGPMCTSPTENDCLAECNDTAAGCPAQASAWRTCVVNPVHTIACSGASPVITGCNTQIDAVDRCFVCLPDAADLECLACSRRSCCEELGDYALAPDAETFVACANACTTSTCFDACVTQNPTAGNGFIALIACQDDGCPEPCICEAASGDDTCTTCSKASCCSQYVDYVLASDLADFEECAIPCADQLCVDDCSDQFPVAGAALRGWSACVDQNCVSECAI